MGGARAPDEPDGGDMRCRRRSRRSSRARALPLAAAAAAAARCDRVLPHAVALPVASGNTFGVLGNWGGISTAPFNTPGQVAAAAGLETVAAATDMLFLVSTGGNFLPNGLPRACTCRTSALLPPPQKSVEQHDTQLLRGVTRAV